MKRSVLGWGDGEGLRVLIPNLEDEDDDDPMRADIGMCLVFPTIHMKISCTTPSSIRNQILAWYYKGEKMKETWHFV